MPVGNIHTSNLDKFVNDCDNLGGIGSSKARSFISDFCLTFDTKINEKLDPFSDDYFQQQVKLYEEISDRKLDQNKWEKTFIDIDDYVNGANPYASKDISFISSHAKAILTTLQIAELPLESKVLDVGSGWGLSSELIAFCGASVTCVDINPLFIELNSKRSSRLGLPIIARHSTFDQYEDDERYDLILFYESLHHALKPWETISHLADCLNEGGKFAFAGEPINKMFWKNWGLRLDPLSVYCIRKFGWFESGWSRSFIDEVFRRSGFQLRLFPGIGLNNGYVGLATKISDRSYKTKMRNLNPIYSLVSSRMVAEYLSYKQFLFIRKMINSRKS